MVFIRLHLLKKPVDIDCFCNKIHFTDQFWNVLYGRPEHFILLGIIGEGAGVGAKVLSRLGINIKDARIEAERVLGYGNSYTFGEVVFSDRAKKILEIAWEKAQKHKNTKIASENLLWAITQTPDSVAMQVLSNLGVDVLEINQGILKELEELKKNDE